MAQRQTPATDLRPRIRKAQAAILLVDTLVATLHDTTAGRTARLKKLWVYNGNAAAAVVEIGTGVVGAAALTNERYPRLRVEPGLYEFVPEDSMPSFEFDTGQDIAVRSSVGGAGAAAVRVMAEVEEIGL